MERIIKRTISRLRFVYKKKGVRYDLTYESFISSIKFLEYKSLYEKWDKQNALNKPFIKVIDETKEVNLNNIWITTINVLKQRAMAITHKKCKRCTMVKTIENFTRNRANFDGRDNRCKSCDLDLRHDVDVMIRRTYGKQLASSRSRGHPKPTYSLKELRQWMKDQDNFNLLYERWKKSGWNSFSRPSVDRIDSKQPYSFTNIQLVTWLENMNNNYNDTGIAFNILNKSNRIIKTIRSIKNLSEYLNVNRTVIYNRLRKNNNKAFIVQSTRCILIKDK